MNYEDERYVRLYVRNTPTWCSWKWEARAVLPLLLRAVDRDGRLEWPKGDDALAVAAVLMLPVKVVVVALRELVRTETIVMGDGWLEVPNFVSGQNVRGRAKSGAERMAELRERRRTQGLCADVTSVTKRDESDHCAQPSSAQLSTTTSLRSDRARARDDTEPALVAQSLAAEPPTASPANEAPWEESPGLLEACSPAPKPSKSRRGKPRVDYPEGLDEHLFAALQAACRSLTPPLRGPRKVTDGMRDLLRKLWAECEPTREDVDHVVAVRTAMTRRGEAYGSLTWDSICVASNFRRWLAERADQQPRAAAGRADVSSRPTQSGVLDIRAARAAKEPSP